MTQIAELARRVGEVLGDFAAANSDEEHERDWGDFEPLDPPSECDRFRMSLYGSNYDSQIIDRALALKALNDRDGEFEYRVGYDAAPGVVVTEDEGELQRTPEFDRLDFDDVAIEHPNDPASIQGTKPIMVDWVVVYYNYKPIWSQRLRRRMLHQGDHLNITFPAPGIIYLEAA